MIFFPPRPLNRRSVLFRSLFYFFPIRSLPPPSPYAFKHDFVFFPLTHIPFTPINFGFWFCTSGPQHPFSRLPCSLFHSNHPVHSGFEQGSLDHPLVPRLPFGWENQDLLFLAGVGLEWLSIFPPVRFFSWSTDLAFFGLPRHLFLFLSFPKDSKGCPLVPPARSPFRIALLPERSPLCFPRPAE